MKNPEKKGSGDETDQAVEKALASGRNANDNFQDTDDTDDYGTDGSNEEKAERNAIKGGAGQKGAVRNRNDDFNNDDQDENE